jgi:hypothetical protein
VNQRVAPPSGTALPEPARGPRGRPIDLKGLDYERELAWLARVLEARDFPLPRLARCLELVAQTTREGVPDEPEVAERVEDGPAYIASPASFLS